MTVLQRALLGAAIGALVVVVGHPDIRPYYAVGAWQTGGSEALRTTPYILDNVTEVPVDPDPKTNSTVAALWMLAAAKQHVEGRNLTDRDHETLARLAAVQAENDPDNAFWGQMESIFLWRLGREDESVRAWTIAARAIRWNDYQGARLDEIVDALRREYGRKMAWHIACAYHRRSVFVAQAIERHAREIRDLAPIDTPVGLNHRIDVILNGRLLRDGSRSNAVGRYGAGIVQLGPMPSFTNESNPRFIELARGRFYEQLRTNGREIDLQRVRSAFRNNDAWLNLVPTEAATEPWALVAISMATGGIPGAFLIVGLFGLCLGGLGIAVERSRALQRLFQAPVAPVVGMALAVPVYAATRVVLAAMWVALCLSFYVFEPVNVRSARPRDLGIPYRWVMGGLGAGLGLCVLIFSVGLTAPGIELAPLLGLPREYGPGSTAIIGIAGILLGLVLLMAPVWAIVKRLPTAYLAALGLQELGKGMAIGALLLAIVAGPLAFAVDRTVQANLNELLQNEPIVYLNQ